MANFPGQDSWVVAAETAWPAKPNRVSIWPLQKKVRQTPVLDLKRQQVLKNLIHKDQQ